MDEPTIRRLPHSTDAEQAVLGAILLDSRRAAEAIELLRPEDFYHEVNQGIFETILDMFSLNLAIDPVTILERMRLRGLHTDDSRRYFAQLLDVTPTAAHIKEHAAIVKDQALLRRVAECGGEIASLAMAGDGEAQTVLAAAEQMIFDIRQGRTRADLRPVSEVLFDVGRHLKILSDNQGKLPGVPTGLPDLDGIIGGMGNSNLLIMGARPGVGKTAIALNIARNATRANPDMKVAFFSLEMSCEQLASRLLSAEALVDSHKIRTGRLDGQWDRLYEGAAQLSKAHILLDDTPDIRVPDMMTKCMRIKNLGLVIVDYLQLIQGTRRTENRVQEVGDISRSLKIMAKTLGVPVLCCSQLSRASVTGGKQRKPVMSDLRESGNIEQDADVVMFLYRDEGGEEDTRGTVDLIVAKNRHGETGEIRLSWIAEYTTFLSVNTRHALP